MTTPLTPLLPRTVVLEGAGEVVLRLLAPSDDLEALTDLLHRAYAPLARCGWNYTAATQDVSVTRRRAQGGTCVVGASSGRLVATATLCPPSPESTCATYRAAGVFAFEQLAVEPTLQGLGLGNRMLDLVEALARQQGATILACDTAQPATHLVAWYERRGHRVVAQHRWPGKAYTSLILARPL